MYKILFGVGVLLFIVSIFITKDSFVFSGFMILSSIGLVIYSHKINKEETGEEEKYDERIYIKDWGEEKGKCVENKDDECVEYDECIDDSGDDKCADEAYGGGDGELI